MTWVCPLHTRQFKFRILFGDKKERQLRCSTYQLMVRSEEDAPRKLFLSSFARFFLRNFFCCFFHDDSFRVNGATSWSWTRGLCLQTEWRKQRSTVWAKATQFFILSFNAFDWFDQLSLQLSAESPSSGALQAIIFLFACDWNPQSKRGAFDSFVGSVDQIKNVDLQFFGLHELNFSPTREPVKAKKNYRIVITFL